MTRRLNSQILKDLRQAESDVAIAFDRAQFSDDPLDASKDATVWAQVCRQAVKVRDHFQGERRKARFQWHGVEDLATARQSIEGWN